MNELTEIEQAALNEALDDEYLSWSTYDQVIADFGEVRPFINIRDAEARHIEALTTLYARYGLAVPDNSWLGNVDRYESVQEACEAAVKAEVANGILYERLLDAVCARPDITNVFENLQRASQERHLPAFERGANRDAGGGGAMRRGRGGPGRGHRRTVK